MCTLGDMKIVKIDARWYLATRLNRNFHSNLEGETLEVLTHPWAEASNAEWQGYRVADSITS